MPQVSNHARVPKVPNHAHEPKDDSSTYADDPYQDHAQVDSRQDEPSNDPQVDNTQANDAQVSQPQEQVGWQVEPQEQGGWQVEPQASTKLHRPPFQGSLSMLSSQTLRWRLALVGCAEEAPPPRWWSQPVRLEQTPSPMWHANLVAHEPVTLQADVAKPEQDDGYHAPIALLGQIHMRDRRPSLEIPIRSSERIALLCQDD